MLQSTKNWNSKGTGTNSKQKKIMDIIFKINLRVQGTEISMKSFLTEQLFAEHLQETACK